MLLCWEECKDGTVLGGVDNLTGFGTTAESDEMVAMISQ